MKLEERLQMIVGQQVFQITDLVIKLEQAQARIAELEKQLPAPDDTEQK
jgi:hypothetical protein